MASQDLGRLRSNTLAQHQTEVRNRYKNSVLFVDRSTGELLEAFRAEIDAGEMIVIVTGDHGEELWDHGGFGHAATRFTDVRTRVPLLICGAGVPETIVPLVLPRSRNTNPSSECRISQ